MESTAFGLTVKEKGFQVGTIDSSGDTSAILFTVFPFSFIVHTWIFQKFECGEFAATACSWNFCF